MRPRFQWDIGRRTIPLGERTLIMGVLNVTPDSFSDGGLYFSPQDAIAHGLALLDEGADILDIGGESTRPGTPIATPQALGLAGAVSADEELARVLPVIEAIKSQRPDALLSIDTYKAKVARLAVTAGAEIVNDVSGFTWDSAMPLTVGELTCGAILMQSRGLPHQWRTQPPAPDIVSLVREELRAHISDTLDQGVLRRSLVIDPGFGFGKNFDENYPLLAHFSEFHILGLPLLAAVSRKSFLTRTASARLRELAELSRNGSLDGAPYLPPLADVGSEPSRSSAPHLPLLADVGSQSTRSVGVELADTATLAATVAAVLAGAHIVRVHAVRPAVIAIAIADAILRAQ
jgi:dihydropteroate synthase